MFAGEFHLGFVALTDAAPLIVAERRGLFRAEGLRVRLSREVSWATLRDRLAAGLVDGAHMLASVALASRLGLFGPPADLIAPLTLNAHGAAVTLAPELAALIETPGRGAPSAMALKAVIVARRAAGQPPLTFGIVLAVSTHAYLLRDWLAGAGIDPDHDVRLRVAPPTAMVEALRRGELDGFCVGAPWGAVAEASGAGRRVLDAGQLQPFAPDKVFAVSEAWADRNPAALQAMLRALIRAARWADAPANREALLDLLARPDTVGADRAALARDLEAVEATRRIIFAAEGVGRPDPAYGDRLAGQLRRWSGLAAAGGGEGFYRRDLYDAAQSAIDRVATLQA